MGDHADVHRLHGYHPLPVKAVIQETEDTRSFVLDVPEDLADLFAYRAGQFCTFRVHVGGEELLRSYSMSSAPETDGDLTVTVKRVPGGAVSGWFHDHVAEGDVLEVTKPAGVFCPRAGEAPVVAFCAGSGVTPVFSIAKSVLASTARPVRMLYANRDGGSVIFRDRLEELHGSHPYRLTVHHHLDDAGGYLTSGDITAFLGDRLDADVYVCGPTPFMDLVETSLLAAGVAAERISIERFVNAGQDPLASVRAEAAGGASPPPTGDEVPASITVLIKGKRHDVTYRPGDTVLETARRAGLQPPFSCEAGNCATCMAMLHEGAARMRVNNALTPAEVEEGWVLTCQALPTGQAVTVEYEPF